MAGSMTGRFYTRGVFAGREPNYGKPLPSFASISAGDAAYREDLERRNEAFVDALSRYFRNGGRG